MINVLECLVINACSVTTLDHILRILKKKHIWQSQIISAYRWESKEQIIQSDYCLIPAAGISYINVWL